MAVKLVDVLRSNVLESSHRGDLAVVTSKGETLYEVGNSDRLTFFRSASKPFQMIAALEAGIAEAFRLDLKEIAICLSSHSGEKEHVELLKSMMEKVGIEEKELTCGIHDPINKEAASELTALGQKPSKLHCNCSGKHIALIAAAKAMEATMDGYHEKDHEIQRKIDKVVAEFSGVRPVDLIKAYDGCGLPVHAVPLKNIAQAFANLSDLNFSEGKYKKSQNYISSAMTMYPEMVAGKGRLDTELMKAFGDRLIGKIGAEGVYCVSLLGKSVGVALKIEDGNSRAVGPVILEALLQMKVIEKEEIERLKGFWKPALLNHNGEHVGVIKPCFKMK